MEDSENIDDTTDVEDGLNPSAGVGNSEMMQRVNRIESPDVRRHFRELVQLYWDARAAKYQIQELYEAGILDRDAASVVKGAPTESLCNQRRMAEILNERYGDSGKVFHQKQVERLLKKWRGECVPWIREVELQAGGRLRVEGFLRHFEATQSINEVENATINPMSIDHNKARRERAAANKAEREDAEQERRFSERWMLSESIELFCEAFGVTARNTARDLAERSIRISVEEKIKVIVTDGKIAQTIIAELRPLYQEQFEAWQSEFCQRLEELSKDAKENSDKQKQQDK